jgi:hypothetical protein
VVFKILTVVAFSNLKFKGGGQKEKAPLLKKDTRKSRPLCFSDYVCNFFS